MFSSSGRGGCVGDVPGHYAGDLEEDTTVHRAGIGAMHVTSGDDPRGVDRREWDPESVRDVHVRTEGQDAEHDLAADQRAGGLLDRAVAARDDTRVEPLGHRDHCEIGRGRMLGVGQAFVEYEAAACERRSHFLQVALGRGPVASRGIHDEERAHAREDATDGPVRGYHPRTLVLFS